MPRLLFALAVLGTSLAHAADTFTFNNKPGPYAVGLRVDQQYDRTRVFKAPVSLTTGRQTTGERARPLQILTWYPAQAGGKALTFRDYLALHPTETEFTRPPAQAQRITDAYIANTALTVPELTQMAGQALWAVRNAPARKGAFPVVIYAPSFGASANENADLCEYLASQGYVVLASTSQGAHGRSMTADLEGAEAQAADIEYLIGYASGLPDVDASKLAVVGFSWGGLANVLAAARDDRIKALVSLDGSVRYYPEMVDGGKTAARYVTPANLAVPMMFVSRRPSSMEELNRHENSTAYSLMNKMTYADMVTVTMLPMVHPNFASDALRLTPGSRYTEYSRAEVSTAYGWMSEYVRRFLDAYLKGDRAARTFLANKPVENGVPPHVAMIETRAGAGAPPTRATFAKRLAEQGFDQAGAIYAEMKAHGADFSFDADAINSWGYELLQQAMPKEAVAILSFGTELFPKDANLFDSLAEAQAGAGQREDAIRNYRRSLELDPKNENAVVRLKVLGAAP